MGSLLDPQYMLQPPYQDEIVGPASLIFLGIFAVGFIVATFLYLRPPARVRAHGLRLRLSQRIANALMWTFGIGLVFFGFRALGLPFLGWRLWTYVTALALVVVVGYILYYLRTSYPKELAGYEAQQLKRYYQQRNRRRPVAADGVVMPRSPRAEKRRQRSSGARSR